MLVIITVGSGPSKAERARNRPKNASVKTHGMGIHSNGESVGPRAALGIVRRIGHCLLLFAMTRAACSCDPLTFYLPFPACLARLHQAISCARRCDSMRRATLAVCAAAMSTGLSAAASSTVFVRVMLGTSDSTRDSSTIYTYIHASPLPLLLRCSSF